MSQESESPRVTADLRTIAHAAPTAKIEREELAAAEQQAERERIAKLGGSAELVLELEAKLAAAIDDRKRAQVTANYASGQLEQAHQLRCLGHGLRLDHAEVIGYALERHQVFKRPCCFDVTGDRGELR